MQFLAAVLLMAVAAVAPSPKVEQAAATGPADAAFDRLKQLEGVWLPAGVPESPLRIRFYTTARGTVLVESWEVRGRPHSLTIYHRDGRSLLATHYCPQGNQPRLKAAEQGDARLHFAFVDATDLDARTEAHQHELWFDLADPARPVRGEVYRSGDKPGEREEMVLERVPEKPEPGSGAEPAPASRPEP